MERHEQRHDELTIDLGSVTAETKGNGLQGGDTVGQLQIAGLTDD
jgi:hypothetical protein